MIKIKDKIAETIKQHDNLCIYIFFTAVLIVFIYIIPLNIYDELWNFSFIYKMTNGYIIYKDLNVIITPLFHYLGKIIFIIFGSNYLSFRLFNIIICSFLYLVIYQLFKKIKISKKKSLLYTIVFYLSTKMLISAGANYNVLVFVFIIIGINLELSRSNKKILNIIKGINLFCIFMCKQNVFIYYSIALCIVYLRKIKNKEINIVQVLYIVISFVIPSVVFLIYLNYTKSLEDFISYCFMGILEFGNNNIKIELGIIKYLVTSSISIILSCILIYVKQISIKVKEINYLFLPFSIVLMFTIYPIFNVYHSVLASIIPIILLIYNLHNICIIVFFDEKILKKVTNLSIMCLASYFFIYNIYCYNLYIKSNCIYNENNVYNHIMIENEKRAKINNICKYIIENGEKKIETIILSPEANLYMNILNKNHKDMDLPNLGNFGKKGEDGVISELQFLKENTIILITYDETEKYEIGQESKKINDYIMNNFHKIGEIENFYIYQK